MSDQKTTIFITGANLNIGKQLIQMISKERFRIIAGIDANVDTRDIKDYCDEILELDYDSSESVNRVYEQQVDVLFLLPSKSEERALQAKRLIAGF
jgi:NAD(P)-dependent dehydrogenase (short-subunit alcohol dehydrogenase family)